jgi:hypothetical protein
MFYFSFNEVYSGNDDYAKLERLALRKKFYLNPIFASKELAYRYGAPLLCPTVWSAYIIFHKYKTKNEIFARFKRSSLIRSASYTTRGLCHKTYYGRNLRISVIS